MYTGTALQHETPHASFSLLEKSAVDSARTIDSPAGVSAQDTLKTYASIASFSDCLRRLAMLADPRDWDRQENPESGFPSMRFGRLGTYLNITFTMACRQGLLWKTPAGGRSVMNTGLISRFGLPIFMCFSRNLCQTRKDWAFEDFCEPGCGLGSVIVREFGGLLPEAPSVDRWGRFDGRPVYIDFDHIIRSRAYRLPRLLFRNVPEVLEACRALDGLDINTPRQNRQKLLSAICSAVKAKPELCDALRVRIQCAADASLRMWRRRDDMVALRYSVSRDGVNGLLPLWLTESTAPDLALTLMDCGACYLAVTALQSNELAESVLATEHYLPWWLDGAERVPAGVAKSLGIVTPGMGQRVLN